MFEKMTLEFFNYLVENGYDSGLLMVLMALLIIVAYLIYENVQLRKERSDAENRSERAYARNLEIMEENHKFNEKISNEYSHAMSSINVQIESLKTTLGSVLTIISTMVNNSKGENK